MTDIRLIASNLHVGGGVQVAASLVDEIGRILLAEGADGARRWRFEVSSEVAAELDPSATAGLDVVESNHRPLSPAQWWRLGRHRVGAAVVVFGPVWFPVRADRVIAGYADVTSIYPRAQRPVGRPARAKRRARVALSRWWAGRPDVLVVETPEVAEQCTALRRSPQRRRIEVVANALNPAVLDGEGVRLVARPTPETFLFLFVGRAYPHKNHRFLPLLRRELAACGGPDVRFVVTLTEPELAGVAAGEPEAFINVGPVRLEEIRHLHAQVDAVIFPSLLEASSASPLEALALGVPLLASDRDFVRGVAGDAAVYFDPVDPAAAAATALDFINDTERRAALRQRGREVAGALPDARDRARAVVELVHDELSRVGAGR